jgi:hypothetical protein
VLVTLSKDEILDLVDWLERGERARVVGRRRRGSEFGI